MDDSYYIINSSCRKAFLCDIAGHVFFLCPNEEFQFPLVILKNKLTTII